MMIKHVIMSAPFPPMRGYGDVPLTPAAADVANSKMDDIVNALKRGVLALRVKATVMLNISEDQRTATKSGMNTFDNIIARLDGPSRSEVLAGTLPMEKWLAGAEVVRTGLVEQAQLFDSGSLIDLVSKSVTEASNDLRNIASGAASFGGGLTIGLVIGGLVATGGIIWLMAQSKVARAGARAALSGYGKRRAALGRGKKSKRGKRNKRGFRIYEPEDSLAGYN